MKLKLAVATAIFSVAMCTTSYGQLLDRMLGQGGCGCQQATSCCDTPASTCGGRSLSMNLTINMPFSGCGGGLLGGRGLFGGGCGGGCDTGCNTGCDTGCNTGCGGGGLLSGMGGFNLFNRGGCGGCDTGCAAPVANDCGCGAVGNDCGCGFGGGRLRGLFSGFGSRLGACGGCGAPMADCGCGAAPVAAAPCGCDSGCDTGCGGGLFSGLRGRLGNRGCGCFERRTVCMSVPNFGLLDRIRGRRAACGGCDTGCNAGCNDCGGGMQAVPTPMGTQPGQMSPSDIVPAESNPAVEPAAQPDAGSGARNLRRSPVVDPNAFIIRGGKYTANN